LMDEAELLAGAEGEDVGQEALFLAGGDPVEVRADLGAVDTLDFISIAPVGQAMRRTRRRGRCRGRRGRARHSLLVIGSGGGHAGGRRTTDVREALRGLVQLLAVVILHIAGEEGEILGKVAAPPLGEAHLGTRTVV
jgi:hypothetical protein